MKTMRVAAVLLTQASLIALTPAQVVGQGATGVRPGRMLEVRSEIRLTNRPPEWLAAPNDGRLQTSEGIVVQSLQHSAVSYENDSIGMMVGAFRNLGGCAQDVTVRFHYTNAQWQRIGDPIESEARVTVVEPGGLLPYRFRLKRKTDFTPEPAGYVIEIDARKPVDAETDCPVPPHAFEVRTGKSRSTSRSYAVNGTVRLVVGGPVRPDGVTLTALLIDANDQVLEVLTGAPTVQGVRLPTGMLEDGQVVPFTLLTPVPVGKWVSRVEVYAEVLPGAAVQQRPQ